MASARKIGFGKAAPGEDYPAIYLVGAVDGVYGFFRSDDEAASWVRINDDEHQFGTVYCITGDPRLYGRVYVGTGGRGTVYGDPLSPMRPAIQPVKEAGTNWTLRFLSESGFDYVLEQTPGLGPGMTWMEVATNAGTGGIITIPASASSAKRQESFRVRVESPR